MTTYFISFETFHGYIFDLSLHVNAKRGNGSEEIVVKWQNNSLCQTNVSWVLYVKFNIEKHCLVKHFALLKNVCYQFLNFVLWVTYLLIGPQPT